MSGDSHSSRNAAQLRELERAQSLDVVSAHNALVGAVDLATESATVFDVLDDERAETLDDALDQVANVAASLEDDDRLLDGHERLLATPERDSE